MNIEFRRRRNINGLRQVGGVPYMAYSIYSADRLAIGAIKLTYDTMGVA